MPYGTEIIPYGSIAIAYGNNSIFAGFEVKSYRKVGLKNGSVLKQAVIARTLGRSNPELRSTNRGIASFLAMTYNKEGGIGRCIFAPFSQTNLPQA